jgi:amino-acid N-acetyltransferase
MRSAAPVVTIRPARETDAGAIAGLLTPYAVTGLVLPRTEAEIRHHVQNFLVAVRGKRGAAVGCVALRDYGAGLFEVRSLAVAQTETGNGLGSRLVQAAVDEAKARGCNRIFALTLRAGLFCRLGFIVVEKELFPQKVWTDCKHCKKLECCDEIAVLLDFSSAPGAG